LTQTNAQCQAMKRRLAGLLIAAAGAALLVGLISVSGTAQDAAPRLSFVIATGASGGTYFPVGEAIAAIVSHPPGVARCEALGACGPVGLIASARTSSGAGANVRDVNAGRADSALAQSDVIAEAVAGKAAFRSFGAQTHIRTIATLFPEDVLVIAAKSAGIRTLADLKGKRVSMGSPGSGTLVAAKALLDAARLTRRIRASNEPADIAAQRLAAGKLDAFVFVGGAPVPLVQNLASRDLAVLVPIDETDRRRLLAQTHGFVETTIPTGEYAGQARTETVATHAVLIVNENVPADIVFGITRSLFNPANRQLLAGSHPSAGAIRLETATADLPAPLHPGAARYYAQTASLPARTEAKSVR
jgi:TRAP transporter TAXI family solute receptor